MLAALGAALADACDAQRTLLHAAQVAARLLELLELRRGAPFLAHLDLLARPL